MLKKLISQTRRTNCTGPQQLTNTHFIIRDAADLIDEGDGFTRLGYEVDGVESVLALLRDQGGEVVTDLKQTQWDLRAIVKVPDGRSVKLVQK